MSSDMVALISLAAGLASLLVGILSAVYARDAAVVSRKALRLAESEAAAGPAFEITPTAKDSPIRLKYSPPPRSTRKMGKAEASLLGIMATFSDAKQERVDGHIEISVRNAGNRAANGVTGWIQLSPAFLKPVKVNSLVSLSATWGVNVSEEMKDGSYQVYVWDNKITPGTRTRFAFPVRCLQPGTCSVTYRLVCDEGLEVEGEFLVEIVLDDLQE